MSFCDSTLSLCVGGLISAIAALAWSLKQEISINKLKNDLNDKTL